MEDSYRFRNDDLRGWCIGKHRDTVLSCGKDEHCHTFAIAVSLFFRPFAIILPKARFSHFEDVSGVTIPQDKADTALTLRTLKDKNGNYLWRQSDDTILSSPIVISPYMPDIAAGSIPVAFGDLSYFWILERQPLSVKILTELYSRG